MIEKHLSSQRHCTSLRRLGAFEVTTKNLNQRVADDGPAAAAATTSSSPVDNEKRPRSPSTGFAKPPPPLPAPVSEGLGALVNSPPHLLADERYMKEKLQQIAQSADEKEV